MNDLTRIALSRRGFLLGSLGLAVSGCGENPIGRDVLTAIQYATTGLPGPEITRELVNQIPYASIAARIGRGPRSLLVLWEIDGETLTWLSADNIAILTKRGRIIRTAGLPEDLNATRFPQPDPLALGHEGISAIRSPYGRLIDLNAPRRFDVEIVSEMRVIGQRTIEIASIGFDTVLVEETCRARHFNWKYQNRFWLDPVDAFVWKSEQYTTRETPRFVIEALKPPAA